MGEEIKNHNYISSFLDEHLRILENSLTELLHKEYPISGPRSLVDGENTIGRIYLSLNREGEYMEDFLIKLRYESNERRANLSIGYGKISPKKESHIILDNFETKDLPPAYNFLKEKLKIILGRVGFGVTTS
jgi:hypothetical protein